MRRVLNSVIVGALTGALVLSVAWATSGLIPVGAGTSAEPPAQAVTADASLQQASAEAATLEAGQKLPPGLFKVGASDVSIAPVPVNEGGPWLRHDPEEDVADPGDQSDGDVNCNRFHQSFDEGEEQFYTPFTKVGCLRTFDNEWATGVDEAHDLGVYARALAISNGESTIVFTGLDTISWFYGVDPKFCPDDPEAPMPQDTCGSRAIAQSLSTEFADEGLNIPPQNFVIAATHTHASADTAMASPAWYFELVRDATKDAIREAVDNMQLATLQTGATPAKPFNVDRRRVTRAIPDYELNWLRAIAAPPSGGEPGPVEPGRTISTLVNYSVHTTVTASNHDLHSGFVGHLAERLNEKWGGNTVFIPGGLGDQTVRRDFGRDGHGYGLAELIMESAERTGHTLSSNDIVTDQQIITVPADNFSLIAANKAGIFVRDTTIPGPHADGPSTSVQQVGGGNSPSCVGASAMSAKTPVGGFLIGSPGSGEIRTDPENYAGDAIAIMQAPGEIFASISLVTKDYVSRTRNTMVLGMANDHLGYIIPAQQYDIRAANAAGIAAPSHNMTDYEESLSTGRCTGDQVQNALLEVATRLGVIGLGEGR